MTAPEPPAPPSTSSAPLALRATSTTEAPSSSTRGDPPPWSNEARARATPSLPWWRIVLAVGLGLAAAGDAVLAYGWGAEAVRDAALVELTGRVVDVQVRRGRTLVA